MLKHVHSTGAAASGRSACSTPVMGSASMNGCRHSRSPSCDSQVSSSLSVVVSNRRRSDASCSSSASFSGGRRYRLSNDDHRQQQQSPHQAMLVTIAANLLSNGNAYANNKNEDDEVGERRSSSSLSNNFKCCWASSSSSSSVSNGGRVPQPPTSNNSSNHRRRDSCDTGNYRTLSQASSFTSLHRFVGGYPSSSSPSPSPNCSFESSSSSSSSTSSTGTDATFCSLEGSPLSTAKTTNGSSTSMTTLKIYARCLRADIEYKTLGISYDTTCRRVVQTLLGKFKMRHRDPNLFYLTMEVWVKSNGVPLRTLIVLDDDARPAELQRCHPRGESKFSLGMRTGRGLVKVYDSCVAKGSQYKSLLVSDRTTADEVVRLVLNCHATTTGVTPSGGIEDGSNAAFALYEYNPSTDRDRRLRGDDGVLPLFLGWQRHPSSSKDSGKILRIKLVSSIDEEEEEGDVDGPTTTSTPPPPPPPPRPPSRRIRNGVSGDKNNNNNNNKEDDEEEEEEERGIKVSWTRMLDLSSSSSSSSDGPLLSRSLSSSVTASPSSSVSSDTNYENYFYI